MKKRKPVTLCSGCRPEGLGLKAEGCAHITENPWGASIDPRKVAKTSKKMPFCVPLRSRNGLPCEVPWHVIALIICPLLQTRKCIKASGKSLQAYRLSGRSGENPFAVECLQRDK
jgi:hypothetical protein